MKKPRLIDLNDAIQHPGRHVTCDVSTYLEEEEGLDLVEPVTGTLDAVSTGNVLLITGAFAARAVLECARCLAPVEVDVKFNVDEEFPIDGVPAEGGTGSYAHVKPDAELQPVFIGNSLLYEELLRQDLWLSLPTRPLCREDCPGIVVRDSGEMPMRPEFEEMARRIKERENLG